MTTNLTILLFAFAIIGCKQAPRSEIIEADHELQIARNGKTLLTVSSYVSAAGDGNQVQVNLPNGEWLSVDVVATGSSPSIYIQRTNTDGSPVYYELQSSGKAINRSEHPLGTHPGDDGFTPKDTAEQDAPSNR